MTAPPVVIEPGASIAAARKLMADHGIHHLPVVEGDRLVGMLSAADVSRASAIATAGETMRREPVTVRTTATLLDAARLLATGRLHSLPVVAPGGAVVGIVTSTDLVRELVQHLPGAEPAHLLPGGAPTRFADADELERVIAAAERHRRAGDDPERLAAATLYLNAKSHLLEGVLRAADLYLHSGQGEHEHTALVRAVGHAKERIRGDLKTGRL